MSAVSLEQLELVFDVIRKRSVAAEGASPTPTDTGDGESVAFAVGAESDGMQGVARSAGGQLKQNFRAQECKQKNYFSRLHFKDRESFSPNGSLSTCSITRDSIQALVFELWHIAVVHPDSPTDLPHLMW